MVPPDWIEQSTPSLPMTCSTTELRRREFQLNTRWRSADSKARGGARTLPQRQVRRKLSSRFHLQRRRGIDLAMTGGRQGDAKVACRTKTRPERLQYAIPS